MVRTRKALGRAALTTRIHIIGMWRSLVARLHGVQEDGGSNPLIPIDAGVAFEYPLVLKSSLSVETISLSLSLSQFPAPITGGPNKQVAGSSPVMCPVHV